MADQQTEITPDAPRERAAAHRTDGENARPIGDGANGHKTQNGADSKYAKATDSGGDEGAADEKPAVSPARKRLIAVVAAVALVFAIVWGVRYWNYARAHVATDDAYVTGNLVNVSPVISGTLSQLLVDEGTRVRKGQLLGRLEDSGPQAALRQARAASQAAQSQIPQAQSALAFQQASTHAAIQRAQAALAAQQARTGGAQQQAALTAQTVASQVRQASAQVSQASAQAAQASAQVAAARAAVRVQRQAVQTAARAAAAADQQIAVAQAAQTRAALDRARYARLASQEAVTQQQYDQALATAQTADAQLRAAREQAAQAHSQVRQAQAGVAQTLAQLDGAQKAADAARGQIEVARAGLGLAQTGAGQVGIQQSNVVSSRGQGGEAQAELADAQAGQTQIALRRQQIATARAQAAQSAAALASAQVTYDDTFLYAPTDGTVVKKAVNQGAALSPGQSVLTLTQGDYVYVSANFKETQLQHVRPGQPVEVEVDAFPGRIFQGRVHSINEATGASTSLLPPDNATGNFTKVVQRIPVRIELVTASKNADKKYARAADIHALRQGMSVTATVDISARDGKGGGDR